MAHLILELGWRNPAGCRERGLCASVLAFRQILKNDRQPAAVDMADVEANMVEVPGRERREAPVKPMKGRAMKHLSSRLSPPE